MSVTLSPFTKLGVIVICVLVARVKVETILVQELMHLLIWQPVNQSFSEADARFRLIEINDRLCVLLVVTHTITLSMLTLLGSVAQPLLPVWILWQPKQETIGAARAPDGVRWWLENFG